VLDPPRRCFAGIAQELSLMRLTVAGFPLAQVESGHAGVD
jgi:hypothetical protein